MTELQEMAKQLQENCKTYTDCSGCPFYCDGCTIYGVPSEWEVEHETECFVGVEFDDIRNAPTIDPVRHGKWAKAYNRGTTVYCKRCNRTSEYKYNYCPNCGAKMDGGE